MDPPTANGARDLMGSALVQLGPDLVVVTAGGIDLEFMYREIFVDSGYRHEPLSANPLIVDVGANIGLFTVWIKRRYPDARVMAFEPAPAARDTLDQNIALHQLSDVVVHQVALGASADPAARFAYYPQITSNSTLRPEEKESQKAVLARLYAGDVVAHVYREETTTVAVERLSSYLAAGQPVDLLKIDVEGAELDVLLGIDAFHWPLINHVIVEVESVGDRLDRVLALLGQHGLDAATSRAPIFHADIVTHMVRASRG